MGSDAAFIRVEADIDVVEESLNAMTDRVLFWDAVLFVLSFAVVFYLISRDTASRIKLANFQKKLYQEKANKDALTGVFSRHYLVDWIQKTKARGSLHGGALAVVMCDINGFKQFNDRHGHEAGDRALVYVAEIMRRHTDETERVIRYGGDEFLIISEASDSERCQALMDETNEALRLKYDLTLAYGIAIATSVEELMSVIKKADERMYRDKTRHETHDDDHRSQGE
jgi:diguanylate cyclase (GGDEF)-like protein